MRVLDRIDHELADLTRNLHAAQEHSNLSACDELTAWIDALLEQRHELTSKEPA